eukprot:TRINITY_DN9618_c0_g1_i2.p1 TRINITY_DN9618_c0_g1~~TRINITY_DN9618_c0_g1_i2.p1  ORF type:complete len:240 (+),score=47.10 TRINITY_DN9618_c0_g1_i2:90-809(+)
MKFTHSELPMQETTKAHTSQPISILPLASINNDVRNTIAELQEERSKQCKAIHTIRSKLYEIGSTGNAKNYRSISSVENIVPSYGLMECKDYLTYRREDIVSEKLAELFEKCGFKRKGENALNMIGHISSFIDKIRREKREIEAKYEELASEHIRSKGKLKMKLQAPAKSRNNANRKELVKTHDIFAQERFKSQADQSPTTEFPHSLKMKKLKNKEKKVTKKQLPETKRTVLTRCRFHC